MLYPMRNIAPNQSGCITHRWGARPEQQQALSRGTRHRQREHHNGVRHDAPFHFLEATHHKAAHREAVGIRPQSHLLLSDVALLSAALHWIVSSAMPCYLVHCCHI